MVDFSKVRELRDQGMKQADIGKALGISRSYVSDILCGRTGWSEDGEDKIRASRQEVSRLRSRLAVSLRNEALFSSVADVFRETVKPIPRAAPMKFKRQSTVETAVLVISDGHHDQVVRREDTGGLERHDFAVSQRRAAHLIDSVIKFCTRTLSGYCFPKLHVLFLGDATNGEIHGGSKYLDFPNILEASVAVARLYAMMLRDLHRAFPLVETTWVSGNHGRRTPKKDYPSPTDNFDWLIANMTKSLYPSVGYNIPTAWDTVVDIDGYRLHASHGDDISNNGGNPWTGLRRRHERQASIHRHTPVDGYVIGHHHTPGITRGNGVDFVSNGAWVRTCSYAYQSLGVAGEPCQWLFSISPKRQGITWRLPVTLDGPHDEEPCRYEG